MSAIQFQSGGDFTPQSLPRGGDPARVRCFPLGAAARTACGLRDSTGRSEVGFGP